MYERASIGPIRPPSEASSLLIRVTRNCPWNRCEFCTAFKGLRFQVRPLDEVRADVQAARQAADSVLAAAVQQGLDPDNVAQLQGMRWISGGAVRNIFLQDSDSLALKTPHILEVLGMLREAFPGLERVCTYARGKTIYRKSLAELQALRAAGLSRLHIGLETGDDELLARIQKGATAAEMIEAGQRAVEAGLEVSEYVMPGLGGREGWERHAVGSARVLNHVNPRFIRLRTFHPPRGTPIFERAVRGEYHLQTIEGVLIEVRRFIEELDVASELVTSDFSANYFMGNLDGTLPGDKARILEAVDQALSHWRRHGEPARHPFHESVLRGE